MNKILLSVLLVLLVLQLPAQQKPENGPYKDYFKTGELMVEGSYKNSKRDGEWKRYYKSGIVSYVSYYEDGNLLTEAKSYYEDGQLKDEVYFEKDKYYKKGYYKTGALHYYREHRTGFYKEYREDGTLKVEANYYDYQLQGIWKSFDQSERLIWEVMYNDGYRNGTYKTYYNNGTLKCTGVIIKEKKQGEEKRFDESGHLLWKGKYNNNQFSKTWIKYNTEGKKILKVNTQKQTLALNPTLIPDGNIEKVPVYRGCETVFGNRNLKNCMSEKIQKFIVQNFNKDVVRGLKLRSKRQRIFVAFKINKEGDVTSVVARAAHPLLEKEAIRVIRKIPKLSAPGTQKGKPVIVPYSLPIVFQLQ